MTTLTPEQIGVLIYANKKFGPGGSKDAIVKFLDTAIAVALAESGGVTDRVGGPNKNGSYDYGLWQINKSAHAGLFTSLKWDNPADNTEMARIVYDGAGKSFKPWAVYNSGAYRKHLGHGQKVYDALEKAVKGEDSSYIGSVLAGVLTAPLPGGPAIGALLQGPLNGVTDSVTDKAKDVVNGPAKIVAGAVESVLKWLAEAGMTVGAWLLSIVLIGLGVWFIVSNSKAYQNASGGIAKVATLAATKGA